jgi:glycosyltransferase involved in cell wall biosynthesis
MSFWLSLGAFATLLYVLVVSHFGLRRVAQLAAIPDELGNAVPKVSIVFSALNEAATIEPALRSLLALDYPGLEIIAIDDRSTDATGPILDRLAQAHAKLRVLHVAELPAGWLGKNHALHCGAAAASGEFLLFTDADVVFEPRALRRAVSYAQRHRLDHLVVMAEFIVRQNLLASLLLNFYSFGFVAAPPWKVRTSRSVYLGMGAFNLVRAASYRAMGGHAALRLEVVDDIMLGKRMKQHGFAQDILFGLDTVALEWYRDAGELARGLEKNSFAMLEYSLARLAAMTLGIALLRYWPIAGLLVTSGAAWWLNAGAVAAALLIHLDILRLTHWRRGCLWWWPLAAAIMVAILWRAVLVTIRRRGVLWRGTLYPLDALKRAHCEAPREAAAVDDAA